MEKKKKTNSKKKVIKEKKINKEKEEIVKEIEKSEEIYGIVAGDEDETESKVS